jgi:alpha-tubulin suppressor-like RCC1 family protein
MSTQKITIKFSDDNGDPSGQSSDSDNTGYRIYRAVGSDPSNTHVNKIYDSQASNNPPTQGTGEIIFEDNNVEFNKPYYYRVENFRTKTDASEETALSPLVGPISIQDLDRLGYPNNTPSDQDGIATYSISVEPLIHYDASQEVKKHGIDHNYGAYNGTVENLSSRFSGASVLFKNGGLHMGIDGVTPEFRCHDSYDNSNTTVNVWDLWLFNQQIRDKIGIDPHVESRVVLDEGACFFYIAPSVYNHSSLNSDNKGDQLWGQNQGIKMRAVYGLRASNFKSYQGDDYILKNHLTIKFSDGSNWQDPEPWAGDTVNDKDPGWYPTWQNHLRNYQTCFGFSHHSVLSDFTLDPTVNLGDTNSSNPFTVQGGYGYVPLTYGYGYGDNKNNRGKLSISNYPDIASGTWNDSQSKYTDCKINVYCKRIYPNGSFDFFINGVKAHSTKQVMFPGYFATGSRYKMKIPEEHIHKSRLGPFFGGNVPGNVFSGTWWNESPKRTVYSASLDPDYMRPIEPYPYPGTDITGPYSSGREYLIMTHPPAFGLNGNTYTGIGQSSYWNILSGSSNVFNELLLIPSDLTANSGADFNTMISYINSKYESSTMFAEQGDYSDLPEQNITWNDDPTNIQQDFEFTASSDQEDATIVYNLSSNDLGTLSSDTFTPRSMRSILQLLPSSIEVTATALATSTHVQKSVTKNLTIDKSNLIIVNPISAGNSHTVYLKSDGTVWAAGSNGSGQLGDGNSGLHSEGGQLTSSTPVRALSGVASISAGYTHTVYLKIDGTVWAAGNNSKGQLGDGTENDRSTPVQVSGLSGLSGVVGISGGGLHTVYLKSDGTVWASGWNEYGQLGDGTENDSSTPVQVKNEDGSPFTGVVAISAGYYHTVYLKSDNTVWATGWNNFGQLGDGTEDSRSNPVQVLSGFTAISAGFRFTVYLKSDGTVWATGQNEYYGQLGDGTIINRTSPVKVSGLSGVVGISAGSDHAVYLKSDNTVWAAGRNSDGQLGNGTTANKTPNPVQVQNENGTVFSGVASISAGKGAFYAHTVYSKSDGTVWAAGRNNAGQLGDGTENDSSTPVQVVLDGNVFNLNS